MQHAGRTGFARHIVGIDAEKLCETGGSLHSITMNLGRIDRFPVLPIPLAEQDEASDLLVP